ncbi:hypothetical protein [Hyphomicrobium sp.]|uniref:hypothetical protein n=1 Tax=Hyphomicrobium sp. TaxID=82 RepID=UPI001D61DF77|nr:hypothetical protein [Hyphomicrobium sp.]MBY0561440.1 hypothetical protein [Hyphomicrobium sp.]
MTEREWFCLFVGWVIGSFGLIGAFLQLVGTAIGAIGMVLVGGFLIAYSSNAMKEIMAFVRDRNAAQEVPEPSRPMEFDRIRKQATTVRGNAKSRRKVE